MVKHFNVIMAGLISGIVALFTSFLGISGTIIGSVLSSFLYQLLSSYSQEKYEEYDERGDSGSRNMSLQMPNLASEVAYVFPIVVIIFIELLFILTDIHYSFVKVFNLLEVATANNLFRVMGIALIVLGIYPLIASNNIDRKNAYVLFIIGFLVFLRGILDMTPIFYILYDRVITKVDPIFAFFVVLALSAVVINILRVSFDKSDGLDNGEQMARKVETHISQDKIDGKSSNSLKYPKSKQESSKKYNSENPEVLDDGVHYKEQVNNGDSHYNGQDNNGGARYNDQFGGRAYYDEDLPIYEEDYIYVENPDDPNHPIRRKILRKIKPASNDDMYYDDVLEEYPQGNPQDNTFNSNSSDDLEYSSRKRVKRE